MKLLMPVQRLCEVNGERCETRDKKKLQLNKVLRLGNESVIVRIDMEQN